MPAWALLTCDVSSLGSALNPKPYINPEPFRVPSDFWAEGSPEDVEPFKTILLGRVTQRVHVGNNDVFGCWVIGIMVQALGKYMIIRYLDP